MALVLTSHTSWSSTLPWRGKRVREKGFLISYLEINSFPTNKVAYLPYILECLDKMFIGFSWYCFCIIMRSLKFRKGRGTRDQIANICWIIKKATEFQINICFCFIDYAKAFVWITNSGKFLKRWEYQTTWPASWEICMQIRKQQLELDVEQLTGSK